VKSAHGFVYKRDEWTCQMPQCLCPYGRAISRRLKGKKNPWAPSVDHIVPLAVGGTSAPANLRAAHQLCNVKHATRFSRTLANDKKRREGA
jgi:5-methylcytosine-specific restriction endonuclease McrA